MGLRNSKYFSTRRRDGLPRLRDRGLRVEPLEPRLVLSTGPIITEFMASNDDTLLDGDGNSSDWIEVHNPTDQAIDIEGWYLTDNADNLQKWAFPDLSQSELDPGEYLVVFASNQSVDDHVDALGYLHTNFKLNTDGEYLALVEADGETIAHGFAPTYPPQFEDDSYGLGSTSADTLTIDLADIVGGGNGSGTGTASGIRVEDGEWTTTDRPNIYGGPSNVYHLSSNQFIDGVFVPDGNGGSTVITISSTGLTVSGISDSNGNSWSEFWNGNSDGYVGGPESLARLAMHASKGITFDLGAIEDARGGSQIESLATFAGTDGEGGTVDFYVFVDGVLEGSYSAYGPNAKHDFDITLEEDDRFLTFITSSRGSDGVDHSFFGDPFLTLEASATVLVGGETQLSYLVPTDGTLGTTWAVNGFDDSSWTDTISGGAPATAGIGYENNPGDNVNYSGLLDTEIPSGTITVYTRHEFTVDDASDLTNLLLRMRYDDGFVAYINGTEVASDNAPTTPAWNSTSDGEHYDDDAIDFQDFNISQHVGLLQDGTNVLAIHGMNVRTGSSDMLHWPELQTTQLETENEPILGYFSIPTPGQANVSAAVANAGPLITNVTEDPGEVDADTDLTVVATIAEHNAAVQDVYLNYRVNYENETAVAIFDDGLGADSLAGDGVYTGVIPATVYAAGDMVRWKITSVDVDGNSSKAPRNMDVSGTRQSPKYFGTVVADPSVSTDIAYLQWFIEGADPSTFTPNTIGRDGTRGSVFYNDEFYDNMFIRLRGGSIKSFKFKFNKDYHFQFDADQGRVGEFNFNSVAGDKAYIRQVLTYDTYAMIGQPATVSFPMRADLNGEFYRVYIFVEQTDEDMLDREDLDPNGALYKMYNTFVAGGTVRKQTRMDEDHSDLETFISNINGLTGTARHNYIFDNVNIPGMLNYLTGIVLVHQNDHPHKNHYLYRDTEGTGEWQFLPWDNDLTFGRGWWGGYYDDRITADGDHVPGVGQPDVFSPSHPFVADSEHNTWGGNWNRLIDAMLEDDAFREMYLRRLRTGMDEILQAPGTPGQDQIFENRIDELVSLMAPDVALDFANGTNPSWGESQTFEYATNLIKTDYLIPRRSHLFETHLVDNAANYDAGVYGYYPYTQSALIPHAQIAAPSVSIDTIEYNPASGNQDQEYITIHNPGGHAIDISGWTLEGGVTHTFEPGSVIAAGGDLHLTPDSDAFRSRTTGPSGNQGLLVQQGYNGHLSNFGETLTIKRVDGSIAAEASYEGDPSPEQLYLRITEFNYNPHDALTQYGELDVDNDLFEFIELVNTSATETLDLAGVFFSDGIDFTFGAGQTLAPGERILVARDVATFESRYGTGLNIAGAFQNGTKLSNGGETIKLDDATGSTILDFTYDDGWVSRSDGQGSSLVVIDMAGNYDAASNWRASTAFGGTPDAAAVETVDIIINEVLAHTDEPDVDTIELYNMSGTAVDLGHWWLSDSSDDYFKYQFAPGSSLAAAGYLLLDENDFNPGRGINPTDFALGSGGDDLWLLEADAQGKPTRFAAVVSFDATLNGVTLGRIPNGSVENELFPLAASSLGSANGLHRSGDIVISEVHYHPAPPQEGDTITEQQLEFVELYNRSAASVVLNDGVLGGWRVRGGIDFDFDTLSVGTTLAAGDMLVLVSFDPNDATLAGEFRSNHGIDESVLLIGPYTGILDNGGEAVRLLAPTDPPLGEVDPIYYLVDRVTYDDAAPWPTDADGTGSSLGRIYAENFGDFASSWQAITPTPGSVAFVPPTPGDFDTDGDVDGNDLNLWEGGFGTTDGASVSDGDADGDGDVDGNDFLNWQRNYQPTSSAGSSASEAASASQALPQSEPNVSAEPTFSSGNFDSTNQPVAENIPLAEPIIRHTRLPSWELAVGYAEQWSSDIVFRSSDHDSVKDDIWLEFGRSDINEGQSNVDVRLPRHEMTNLSNKIEYTSLAKDRVRHFAAQRVNYRTDLDLAFVESMDTLDRSIRMKTS